VIENATGTACEQDIDYYPYGGEENDYCSTPVAQHYKFTGTERDSESGLDNFGARYNASTMGRFMSPDPLGGHQEDPQTLNRYSYVRNNPLSLTDPTGLDFYLNCLQDSSTCQGGHVGTTTTTTDANGNTTSSFTATVVTSASLQDPNSGNTATVNQNGVQITTGGQTYQGTFISNTPAADVQGSGQLQDFSFHINGNCGGSCFTSGEWSYNGSLNQARALLYDRGSFTIPFEDSRAGLGLGAHPFSTQHRFGGSDCSFLSCANSPHLSVAYDPGSNHYVAADDVAAAKMEPKANVPSTGGFHVDAHADWIGHAQDVSNAPPH
jgi:RHS repeat-associated protein